MRRSPIHLALAFVTGALAIAACGSDDDGGSGDTSSTDIEVSKEGIVEFRKPEPGSGKGLKLGYIALDDSIPFARVVTESMVEQARVAGARLITCDPRSDGQKALDCAKSLKTQGVDGYLNYQVEEQLSPAVCDAGPDVFVIAITIKQRPCEDAFMGAANGYAGFIAGKAMGEFAEREWNCDYDAYVSLEAPAAGITIKQRMDGYRSGFQSVCDGDLKNERVLDANTAETARTRVTDTLTALPGQDRILVAGGNDDSVLGALAAAETAGREDDIWVSGQGADQSAWCEIKNNPQWIVDTAYFPERWGEIGIPHLIDAVKGKKVPKQLLVEHKLVTGEQIDELYELAEC